MPIVLRPGAMRAELPIRLRELGQSRKLARALAGAFATIATLVGSVLLLGLLDSIFHLPVLVRAVGLAATILGTGAVFLRVFWKPFREPVGALGVAHWLESLFPKLNCSLASAVDFLVHPVNESTSARFRRVAVVRAQRAFEKCNLNGLIPTNRAMGWAVIALVLVATTGGLALVKPAMAQQSLARLFDPFGMHPWPTKTQLKIVEPEKFPVRAALGEPFELKFQVMGVIPEVANLDVQFDNGNRFSEPIGLSPSETRPNFAEVQLHLEAHRIPRKFEFRIRANDTDTGWLSVDLAPAPKLVPRDGRQSPQIHATYPGYSDLAAAQLPDGSAAIEAVPGTRLRLKAATDRRVISASLVPQIDRSAIHEAAAVAALGSTNFAASIGAQLLADSVGASIPVTISGPEGTWLDVDFVPTVSGLYALKFADETGLVGNRLLDFRLPPDPAPVVTLDRPTAELDPLVLLPTASTMIQARAEDRTFAVKRLFLEYRVGGPDAPLRIIPLVDFPALGRPLLGLTGGAAGLNQVKQPACTAVTTLPISMFTKPDGSAPVDGDRIIIRAAATDYDDVSVLKDPGRSKEEVTILVVNRPALDTFLQQELAKLRPQLLQAREQERQIREKTEEVQKNAADGKLTNEDSAKLGQAERDQRAVRNTIAEPRDGLKRAAELLQQTIRANNVPRSQVTERVEGLVEDLGRLATQNLDPIEPLIASAKQEADKGAEGSKPDPKKVADDLKRAVRQEKAAEANLDAMLKRLEQWGGAGEVKAEVRALKNELNKAAEGAKQASEKVEPGKPAEQLTPMEKAELTRAAEKFQQLAERATGTIGKAERLAAEKEAQALALKEQSDAKAAEANAAKADAKTAKPGSPEQKAADAKANAAQTESENAKADSAKAQAEADALRKAVKNGGNQELLNELKKAGNELQKNNAAQSGEAQKAAADKLDQFSEALGEKEPIDQIKKKKELGDEAFELEKQQDELRKKIKAAEKIEDPKKREEELKKLGREQEEIQKKAEQLLEKLTRERENDAADKLRESIEKMEAAKNDLDMGKSPEQQDQEALDKLKESVDKLDKKREEEQDKLGQEKRQQLAEVLKGLRERLKATDDEAARIQTEVLKKMAWDRPKLASLGDLEERAKTIAEELKAFAAKELEPLPVFRQLADQASTQTGLAGKRFAERKGDALDTLGEAFDPAVEIAADDRTRRPLKTALRRIDYILDSIADKPKPGDKPMGGDAPMPMGDPPMPMPMGGGDPPPQQGGIPELAQLKALRAIQAELNERTVDFNKAHPDKDKLKDADREDLDELERSQREVAELFEKIKSAFEKKITEPKLP